MTNQSRYPAIHLGVAALAAATLCLESALLRLLAVAQYYHFAFLVVSLALLGFGASGAFLSISKRLKRLTPLTLLSMSGIGFAVSVGIAYASVNWLPFDSYRIAWDPRQIVYFVLYYLALVVPFVFSGLGIAAGLMAGEERSHLVYAANLLGSGVGAILAPFTLWLAGVPGAVIASAALGLLPCLRSPLRLWALTGLGLSVVAIGLLAVFNFQGRAPLGMILSQYKGLAHALRYPGAQPIFGAWNAISRVDVVKDAGLHQFPGLSYTFAGKTPAQIGLSVDGEAMQPISLVQPDDFDSGSYLPEAIAYRLRRNGSALVIEPGGGLGVLQALAGGRTPITAVTGNPLVRRAVAFAAQDRDGYAQPGVQTVVEDGRVFLERAEDRYDVVSLPLTDPFLPVTSGAYSLSEEYLLTVEAFQTMMKRLAEDGLLVVTRWFQVPPSEPIRLIATVVAAMERMGLENPAESLAAFRGVQTITLLIQPDGWSRAELQTVREFTEDRRYDLVWVPDIRQDEVNRFNRLPQPELYEATRDLFSGSDRDSFYAQFPFAVDPPTDDHPFFFHFFTWEQTPEVFAALGRTWQPFGGSGYFVLLAMLALTVVLSGMLILAPLAIPASGAALRGAGFPRGRILGYFAAIGVGFIFVEIPLIQRWILLLGHVTYAFSVVVLALLLFSSVGSALAGVPWLPHRWVIGVLAAAVVITPWVASWVIDATLGWPLAARVVSATLSLAPLGVLMGMPFPLGLAWLEVRRRAAIPWAWGINGCASVVASVLAALLALDLGFNAVHLAGAGAYALAWVVYWSFPAQAGEPTPVRSHLVSG